MKYIEKCKYMLMRRVLKKLAGGLSDVREDAPSDAPPHAVCCSGPRHFPGW